MFWNFGTLQQLGPYNYEAKMIPSSFFFSSKTPVAHTYVHGLSWCGGQTRDKKTSVVAVHGLTRNAWDFAALAVPLAPTRDVIALDMPGRGLSSPYADPHNYAYPNYVASCIAFLEEKIAKPVDWVGTSMGGLIGMIIAATRPDLIRKLVLNDIGPYLPLAGLQRIAQYVGRDQHFSNLAEAERYCRATYADFAISADEDWRRFTLSTIREKDSGGFHLHYDVRIAEVFGMVREDIDLWPVYEKVAAPTLLLRGARSDLLRADEAQKMTLRGPKAQLVTFMGCGHAPALMNAEQIGVIQDFLG